MIRGELGESLEAYVVELIKAGRYGSESEVLQAAVALLQQREQALASFEADLRRRLATADDAHMVSAEEAFEALRKQFPDPDRPNSA
jgi:antitoxin ParD1/3/4